MNAKTRFFIISILVLTIYQPAISQTKSQDDFKLTPVANGIFAGIALPAGLASGNAGFVVGDDGVLVVDTFFTPDAVEELLDAINSQTKQPVKYVVNTHYHLDHTGGNQVFAARDIPILAHDKLLEWQTTKNRKFMPEKAALDKRLSDTQKQLADTPADQTDKRTQLERQIRRLNAMKSIVLTNPNVTFSSGTAHLYLGAREVVLFTLPGHTGGDVLAFVPDANVLFMGDMGWRKTLPNLVDATVTDWIKSLDSILAQYPSARFVPGHGEVATASDIKEFRDYLDDLRSRVQKAMSDGLTVEQAKQTVKLPERYQTFAFQNFAVPNVEDMYKELNGTKGK
ncbi:MAG TPA: MBL fold metallo-hydrolase [Pyrinomonadaceae bacterium]|nr:MBL fold metallo-hydrolase [Pyrinomonadaceae bacterium]